jgi:uroporphyrinogen decarboxylase
MMMNSRQRILAAINHQEPEGLPLDLGATPSSGISAIAYHNLKQYLGLHHGQTRVYDVVQQIAQPEEEILDRYGVDAVDIGRAFDTNDEDWYDIELPNGVSVQFPAWFKPVRHAEAWDAFAADGTRIATMPLGAAFFDQTCFPYLDGYPSDYANLPQMMPKVLWAGLAHSPWNHAGEADFGVQLRQRALALRKQTDRALMIVVGCNLFEWGTFLRRIDNFLSDLVLNQVEVERLLDALMVQHLATLEKVCCAVGDIADIVRFGDDLGTDQGPFMSPKIYRKLIKPRQMILTDYVKKHSQMHTFLHSCGSIYKILPDLIEAGFEIINPVQISAHDMQPERLKREFGQQITFWGGGCDTRTILNRATPAEVKEHVRRNIELLAPGGGFVFNTVHNILPDVPPQNIEAMYEAVAEYQ